MIYKSKIAKKTFWGAYFNSYHIARDKIHKVLIIEMFLHIVFYPISLFERIYKKIFINKGSEAKFLIIELFRLGDVVFTTSLYNSLKKKNPKTRISILAATEYMNYFIDEFDGYYSLDAPWVKGRVSEKNIIKKWYLFIYNIYMIRKENFDLVIDTRCDLRSAFVSFLIGSKRRIGFNNQLGDFFFTDLVEFGNRSTKNDDYKKIAEFLGCGTNSSLPSLTIPSYNLLSADEKKVKDKLLSKRYFVLHPGASWQYKSWGIDNYLNLSLRISNKFNLTPLWIIDNNKKKNIPVDHVTISSPSFKYFKILLINTEFLICNNSGPLHVADAVGCITISFLGPSSDYWKPTNDSVSHIIVNPMEEFYCAPCFETKCLFPSKSCLSTISVDFVFRKIENKLLL